jgi:hypothetical protein
LLYFVDRTPFYSLKALLTNRVEQVKQERIKRVKFTSESSSKPAKKRARVIADSSEEDETGPSLVSSPMTPLTPISKYQGETTHWFTRFAGSPTPTKILNSNRFDHKFSASKTYPRSYHPNT